MSSPVAFVTGASRGIGRGIALALAEAGYDIAAGATRESGLHEVAERVASMGRRFLPVIGDVSDLDAHKAMVQSIIDGLGGVDVLVNNAGVAPLQRLDILETTPESFDRLMAINLRGPFFLTQRVAAQMAAQRGAHRTAPPVVIFVTSISADTASPNRAEYCVSKAGLAMTAQNYAVRLAELGIAVYEIRPGIIQTDMTAGVQAKYDALIEGGLLLEKRWGTPEDIGKACAALAAGALPYAPGAVIEIGGGFGVKRL